MSTDTMRGNKQTGRVIDWRKVAESYSDDLANLILVGNRLSRGEATREEWNAAVLKATQDAAPVVCRSRDKSERSLEEVEADLTRERHPAEFKS